jgi:hypothetical protein
VKAPVNAGLYGNVAIESESLRVQGGPMIHNETNSDKLFRFEMIATSELQSSSGNTASGRHNAQLIKNNANTAEADIKG